MTSLEEKAFDQTTASKMPTLDDIESGSVLPVPAREDVRRDLRERHIQMIAIAGMIVWSPKPALDSAINQSDEYG